MTTDKPDEFHGHPPTVAVWDVSKVIAVQNLSPQPLDVNPSKNGPAIDESDRAPLRPD